MEKCSGRAAPATREAAGRVAFFRAGSDRVNPHWPDNVLQLLFGEIDEGNFEFVTLRQADRARLANALHARGDFDAIAHQVAVGLLDHVAEQ